MSTSRGTSQTTATASAPSGEWPCVSLSDREFFSVESGIWTGKQGPFERIAVVRNTNFNTGATLDLSDVALVDVEARSLPRKLLQSGDIIIERSGGGPKQPVGRVAYFEGGATPFSFSNFTSRLRVLKPQELVARFVHYFLHHFHEQGHTRALQHNTTGMRNLMFTDYLRTLVPKPPAPEQQAIAGVLGEIQRAVEIEDRRIAALKELKAATMAKVFREGLRGEPLKQTEIGQIPRTWNVIPLGSCLRVAQYGLSVRGEKTGRVPILRMNCQQDGRVVFRDLQYVDVNEPTAQAFRLHDGDLLFNRTNSFELVGRTALFSGDREAVFASYLIRLQVDPEMLVPGFLNCYLNLDSVQQAIKSLATRGVSQSNISASKLKTFLVPEPCLAEQREITTAIETIASSLEACEQRRQVRDQLFHSALQQLMTGQLRVTSLLEEEAANA